MSKDAALALFKRAGIPFAVSDWKDEMQLQARIGHALTVDGGHRVYFEHQKAAALVNGKQFKVRGPRGRGRIDLLVVTGRGWSRWRTEDGREMPCIGVEVKLAKNLRWVSDGVDQLKGYADEALSLQYECDGTPLPTPTHFLICTDDSWDCGHLYRWTDYNRFSPAARVRVYAEAFGISETEARYMLMEQSWVGITAAWDNILLRNGMSIMKTKEAEFMTNRFGALRKYALIGAEPPTPDRKPPSLIDLLGPSTLSTKEGR